MSGEERVKCQFCSKDFANFRCMRRHAKSFHFAASKLPKPYKPLTASHAHTRFYMGCPICNVTGTKDELTEHYSEEHSIEFIRKSFTFESVQQFELWKERMEEETKTQFVKPQSARVRRDGSQRLLFVCSKNGYSTSLCTKRQPQQKGLSKIQGYCPAALVAIIDVAGSVSVDSLITHVGHALDLEFIRLTNEEKSVVARKMALNIPNEVILDSIRENLVDNNLERLHLIEKRNLADIERFFNQLYPHMKNANDYVSIDSWVDDMRPSGVVRFYKRQNQDSESDVLKRGDFFLVISSEHQVDMLKKYGPKCISIDSTNGLNAYGFELTTILVLDDLNEGFPGAFLISNRNDAQVMQLFFEVMAEIIGNGLETKVFMSDIADSYYCSWVRVFPRPQSRLFCTWLVDRAWRAMLKKIKVTSRRKEVYQELKTLLEASACSLEPLLETFCKKWMNEPDLKDFGEHFIKEYKSNCHSWALCYHLRAGINTNMHLERMCKTLKYIYLHSNNVKRLDKTVHALIKFTRDKVLERIIFLVESEVSSKIKGLRIRHRTAVDENSKFVVAEAGYGVWNCSSSTGNQTYRIVKNDVESPCNCPLRCDPCKTCIHSYTCSCLDSSIKWNMCEHIHYLCSRTVDSPCDSIDESSCEPCHELEDKDSIASACSKEVDPPVQVVSNPSVKNLEDYKKKIAAIWENVKEELMTASSIEQLQTAENLMDPIIPTLRALKEEVEVKLEPSANTSSDKKRKTEPLSHFTPKKKKEESNETTTKPSLGEQHNIAFRVLLPSSGANLIWTL